MGFPCRLGVLLAACAGIGLTAMPSEGDVPKPGSRSQPIVLALSTFEHPCFTRASLADAIGNWLNRTEIDSRIAIELEVEAGGIVFHMLRDGATIGERRLAQKGLSCADFGAAVSLAIAASIDATLLNSPGDDATAHPPPPADNSDARDAASVPPPAASPPPELARPPPPLGVATSPRPLPRPAGPGVALQLDGAFLGNVLAVPAFALSLAARFDLRGVALRIGELASLPADKTLPGGAATVSLYAARVDICRRFYASVTFALDACAGGLGGVHRAQGKGFVSPGDALTPWVALAAGAELAFFRGRSVEAVLEADAVATLARWQLIVNQDGAPSFWLTGPPVGAIVQAGVRFRGL